MKYAIWNKTDDIYTLSGEKFTAAQWVERYSWAEIPGAKMIIGAGAINGTVAMEFNSTVEMYQAAGCDFSKCVTDDDYLVAIEAFEQREPDPSPDERIAAALEYQNLTSM